MFDRTVKTNQQQPAPRDQASPAPSRPAAGPPIVSFVGHSGTGKTTFIEALIRRFSARGIRVALIKHDVHGFEMDKPGKDTWRHKKAGAVATLISSPDKIGLVMDSEYDHSPQELLPLLPAVDLVITEGYKRSHCPKIEVFRPEATGDRAPLLLNDPNLLAVITDRRLAVDVPVFNPKDVPGVGDLLEKRFLTAGRKTDPATKTAAHR